MPDSTVVYISDSYEPEINLAFEEYLMEYLDEGVTALFLWQNKNAVVIGRHQNPVKECNIDGMKMDRTKLIRRLSGGGAVYHDLGNLNFTFVSMGESYQVESQLQRITEVLLNLGIQSKVGERNELLTSKGKFSGSAFYSHRKRHCHHGTLLVDADLEKLDSYLTADSIEIKSKGIDSVRSKVVNLKTLKPELNVEKLKFAIIESFGGTSVNSIHIDQKLVEEHMESFLQKYRSWEWNFGKTPTFEFDKKRQFDWGEIELHLRFVNGKVSECVIHSTIEKEIILKLQLELIGAKLGTNELGERVDHSICHIFSKEIKVDIKNCFGGL